MIDLAQPSLPSSIVVDGAVVKVRTNFRTWLLFGRVADEAGVAWPGIFPDGQAPAGDWVGPATEFYESATETPRRHGGSSERPLDLTLDGDYIVGSFQSAYGIDLTDPGLDMHWHRFLALIRSMPEDAMVARIGGWRTWEPDRRRPDEVSRERREAWALPSMTKAEEDAAVETQESIFGEAVRRFANG